MQSRDYLSRATAVTEVYRRALESVMRGATKRGDLDEANLIKQEQESIQVRIDNLKVDMFASEIDFPAILEITGKGFTIERMANGQVAFSDRGYKWFNVPAKFEGWQFTRNSGANGAKISIKVKRTGMVFLATGDPVGLEELGFTRLEDLGFNYRDRGRTRRIVLGKPMAAGQTMTMPRGMFGGTIVLNPPRDARH